MTCLNCNNPSNGNLCNNCLEQIKQDPPPGYKPALEGKPAQAYYLENPRQRKPRRAWSVLAYTVLAQWELNKLQNDNNYFKAWYE